MADDRNTPDWQDGYMGRPRSVTAGHFDGIQYELGKRTGDHDFNRGSADGSTVTYVGKIGPCKTKADFAVGWMLATIFVGGTLLAFWRVSIFLTIILAPFALFASAWLIWSLKVRKQSAAVSQG